MEQKWVADEALKEPIWPVSSQSLGRANRRHYLANSLRSHKRTCLILTKG